VGVLRGEMTSQFWHIYRFPWCVDAINRLNKIEYEIYRQLVEGASIFSIRSKDPLNYGEKLRKVII
jgi:hypothetical protein